MQERPVVAVTTLPPHTENDPHTSKIMVLFGKVVTCRHLSVKVL